MARIRTIKPEFWTDEKIVELDVWTRLLFIGLWNFADDEGRMVASEKRIRMQIFPADTVDIRRALDELSTNGFIECYTFDGIDYLQIAHFTKHQKIDRRTASKLPAPNGSLVESSVNPPDGREGNGREKDLTPSAPADKPKAELVDWSEAQGFSVPSGHMTAWRFAYPACDLKAELAKAHAWLLANPKNRKSNYARFMQNWLQRAQDKAPALGKQQDAFRGVL